MATIVQTDTQPTVLDLEIQLENPKNIPRATLRDFGAVFSGDTITAEIRTNLLQIDQASWVIKHDPSHSEVFSQTNLNFLFNLVNVLYTRNNVAYLNYGQNIRCVNAIFSTRLNHRFRFKWKASCINILKYGNSIIEI